MWPVNIQHTGGETLSEGELAVLELQNWIEDNTWECENCFARNNNSVDICTCCGQGDCFSREEE